MKRERKKGTEVWGGGGGGGWGGRSLGGHGHGGQCQAEVPVPCPGCWRAGSHLWALRALQATKLLHSTPKIAPVSKRPPLAPARAGEHRGAARSQLIKNANEARAARLLSPSQGANYRSGAWAAWYRGTAPSCRVCPPLKPPEQAQGGRRKGKKNNKDFFFL